MLQINLYRYVSVPYAILFLYAALPVTKEVDNLHRLSTKIHQQQFYIAKIYKPRFVSIRLGESGYSAFFFSTDNILPSHPNPVKHLFCSFYSKFHLWSVHVLTLPNINNYTQNCHTLSGSDALPRFLRL